MTQGGYVKLGILLKLATVIFSIILIVKVIDFILSYLSKLLKRIPQSIKGILFEDKGSKKKKQTFKQSLEKLIIQHSKKKRNFAKIQNSQSYYLQNKIKVLLRENSLEDFSLNNSGIIKSKKESCLIQENIQQYSNQKVNFFRKIYSSQDKDSNCYESLHSKTNTILLIETQRDEVVVGFSSLSYCGTKDTQKTMGLLIDMKNQQSFYLKKGNHPNKLRDNEIVLGNQELKISLDQMLMQICEKDSSFVSKYKNPVAWKNIFRSSSFKIKSNMKIPIKALEVYEVNFEGKQKQVTIYIDKEKEMNEKINNIIQITKTMKEEQQRKRKEDIKKDNKLNKTIHSQKQADDSIETIRHY